MWALVNGQSAIEIEADDDKECQKGLSMQLRLVNISTLSTGRIGIRFIVGSDSLEKHMRGATFPIAAVLLHGT